MTESERLSESEREASYCTRAECHARHFHTQAVEAILASRLAAVEALADEWDKWLPIYWKDGRRVLDDIAIEDLTAALRAALASVPDTETQRESEGGGIDILHMPGRDGSCVISVNGQGHLPCAVHSAPPAPADHGTDRADEEGS
jgi:hypothetical protein